MQRAVITISAILFGLVFAQVRIGNFLYIEQIDPLTDAKKAYAFVEPSSPQGSKASIIFRCTGDNPEIYLASDHYLNKSEEIIPTIYRIDKNPPSVIQNWTASTNGTAAFMSSFGIRDFVADIKTATSFVIKVQNYESTPYTYIFDFHGVGEVLKRLGCFNFSADSFLNDPKNVDLEALRICREFFTGRIVLDASFDELAGRIGWGAAPASSSRTTNKTVWCNLK